MIGFLKKIPKWHQKYFIRNDEKFKKTFNKALTLSEWGMLDVSTKLYLRCLKIYPDRDFVHFKLAEDYYRLKENEKAIIHYNECLKINEEDPFGVSIKLYLLGDKDGIPPALSKEYIKSLYNQYAPHFEGNLVRKLNYSAPQMAFEELEKINFLPCKILDLGCGTGLGADAYKADNVHIHGVDISKGMIEQSKQKNIYDELFCEDVFDFLREVEEEYDLIQALDLLIYIGALEELFLLVKQRLSKDGLFVFSTQRCDSGYILGEDHRFSHSDAYIESILQKTDMTVISSKEFAVRMEYDVPVQGMIYVCGSDLNQNI